MIDTRKTTPGMRALEKAAVVAGGGANHRFGLHDMVMIKDNHIAAAGGITAAVEAVRRQNDRGLRVEVETTRLDEVREALAAGADRIMFDNMALAADARGRGAGRAPPIRARRRRRPAASRWRRSATTRETGVDFISVGRADALGAVAGPVAAAARGGVTDVFTDRWEGVAAEELAARWGLPSVHLFARVRSTNDAARGLADGGAPHGTLVLAEEQTAGRGRERARLGVAAGGGGVDVDGGAPGVASRARGCCRCSSGWRRRRRSTRSCARR